MAGDFNVALLDIDFYNSEQRRTRKSAGTTPEERSSFAVNLLGRDPPASCAAGGTSNETPPVPPPSPAVPKSPTADGFLVDTFREMHPDATGVFTYWSVRAGNRPVNRGMRLDYCLASRSLVSGAEAGGGGGGGGGGTLHDAFVLDRDTVGVSDHAPVGAVFRLGDHFPE